VGVSPVRRQESQDADESDSSGGKRCNAHYFQRKARRDAGAAESGCAEF
jgi:hypothetical protein